MFKKTAVHRTRYSKTERKVIPIDSDLWYSIHTQREHTKINASVKKTLYNQVLNHPQVVQSPIASKYLKVAASGHIEKQIVPKLLF